MSILFRPQVFASQEDRQYGEIVLVRALSTWIIAWSTVAILMALGLYLVFGSYTKRAQAAGVLTPVAGLIRINAPVGGVIVERRVEEGQTVAKGDVLFVVADQRAFFQTSELAPAAPGARGKKLVSDAPKPAGAETVAGNARVADAVDASMAKRFSMLRVERAQTENVANQSLVAASQEIRQLDSELGTARLELALTKKRVEAASAQLDQFGKLAEQSYMSAAALAQKKDELLTLQLGYTSALRGIAALERQLSHLKAVRDQSPARLAVEIAGLAQREAALAQEAAEVSARGRTSIVAPVDGVVTGMLAEPGTTAGPQALATIVPAGSDLQAYLYVPSRSVGFVKPGQAVLLRYQAFPYQKFGQYSGTVKHVSRAQIGQDQLPEVMPTGTREGLYKIVVTLDKQEVSTYGTHQKLIPGMLVEADILQDKRSLIEWIFEPLLGWTGKW